jgi:hypothetical protein
MLLCLSKLGLYVGFEVVGAQNVIHLINNLILLRHLYFNGI